MFKTSTLRRNKSIIDFTLSPAPLLRPQCYTII